MGFLAMQVLMWQTLGCLCFRNRVHRFLFSYHLCELIYFLLNLSYFFPFLIIKFYQFMVVLGKGKGVAFYVPTQLGYKQQFLMPLCLDKLLTKKKTCTLQSQKPKLTNTTCQGIQFIKLKVHSTQPIHHKSPLACMSSYHSRLICIINVYTLFVLE